MVSKTPLYNLNAVLHEVNISADVLHAWERRYQLPVPQRTPGGHRLYSEYDIEILKWLKSRQNEGLSISQAVNLWRELSTAEDPIESAGVRLISSEPVPISAFDNIDTYCEQWVASCLAFDATSAENILNQALSLFSIESVCLRIIQRGIVEIGEKWMGGSASVQQEHFASALAQTRLQMLIAGTPAPVLDKTIMVACPAGEFHTIPGLLLTLLLRRKGLKVVYLGADTPIAQLAESADAINPKLIVLSAQRLTSARSLAETANVLNASQHPVAFGGQVFITGPNLVTRIAGLYLGDDLEDSIPLIKHLAWQPLPISRPIGRSEVFNHLLLEYEEHRGLIEHQVIHALRDNGKEFSALREVNRFLGDNIAASLALGNLHFLDKEIEWVMTLNRRADAADDIFPFYMKSYQAAIQHALGEIAAPIVDWFTDTEKSIIQGAMNEV